MFSDESRFLLFQNDARQRVYRRPGERYHLPCVQQIDWLGGGSTMVWGAIRFGWKSRLLVIDRTMTAQRYMDTVLQAEIVPHFQLNPHDIFMHNNARPHVAGCCQDMLRDNNITVLPWPAYSADMNPIEHLWDILGRRIRARPAPPQTHAELRQALIEEWNTIPQYQINRLITSMPRRIDALIDAQGAHTRY